MHDTAYKIGRLFFETYWRAEFSSILEIGSFSYHKERLRDFCPAGAKYIGVDIVPGDGVDIILPDGESLRPLGEEFDIVVSTSTFEHTRFFWQTFTEMSRVLKPGGYIYLNAPSNGIYHRCPEDYWRFYPDSGVALAAWARTCGYEIDMIESVIAERDKDIWNDAVMVFRKDNNLGFESKGYLHEQISCTNVRLCGIDAPLKMRHDTEDEVIITKLRDRK